MPGITEEPIMWIAFVCYLEWGLVHIMAGAATIPPAYTMQIYKYLTTICGVAPESVKEDAKNTEKWSPMNVRILIQHGFNLLYVGMWSTALAFIITFNYPNRYSWYFGLWPFFADVAYFTAIDMVEYGALFAEAQTYIISTGQILTAIGIKQYYEDDVPLGELIIQIILSSCLILAGIINKILFLTGKKVKLGEDGNEK